MNADGSAPLPPGNDLLLAGLILHADIVVQIIVAGLVLCSVAAWAIIFEKIARLRGLRRTTAAVEAFARDPKPAAVPTGDLAPFLAAVRDEMAGGDVRGDLGARIEAAARAVFAADLRRYETGLSYLASLGATAPFVGLFGTVWGLMHSFTSIAAAKDTSLAVVAPGIAEALFATATGLAAAIPAVIAYNQFRAALSRHGHRLAAAAAISARKLARADARPAAAE